MKEKQDYIHDISEIRTMMERSTKFLSLSGLAGIMAGIYALIGSFIAWKVFGFRPAEINNDILFKNIYLGIIILILAICTAIFLSINNSKKRNEKFWNASAKLLVFNISVPLIAGGLLILILISKDINGLIIPFTLLFYGLALFNAAKFTYEEVKSLGLIEITLGLAATCFIEYSLLFWALGFGLTHIIYGIYMHYKYER